MFLNALKKLGLVAALVVGLFTADALAQGGLSNQVLQLLSRTNAWIGQNTFSNLRMANAAIPSDTTYRIYADTMGNLYFNGGLIAGAGGGVTPHNLLSTTHADTVASTVARGSIIVGNSTPAWAQVTIGANHTVLVSNGTDAAWGTDGSGLINLTAANLTGTLPAISGVNLTNLNASNLASGTVNVARLSGITNTQIGPAAGITYSNLTLTNGIVNADVNSAAAIAYSKLNLATSILNTDLANTQITFAKWASNSCTNLQVPQSNGTTWSCHSLTGADIASGVVTSVAQTVPTGFTISGSPITTSGTLAIGLSTESANTVWAGPTSGGAVAPAFRALVNADFPTSGATAGTYPLVTVNAQGIVTAGSATLASGTITVSTPWTYTQTWNQGATTFTGILENITDTASTATSKLLDLQVSSTSKWNVDKSGNETVVGLANLNGGLTVPTGKTSVITDVDSLTIAGNKIANTVTFTCTQLNASSASGDCVFIADRGYTILGAKFVQRAQGGAGCVADLETLTGTTAPGSGTLVGSASYNCNATANNTVTTYALSGTPTLASGNRLGIKLSGTLTALAGLTVTVQMKAS